MLEPRGAVMAELLIGERPIRVIGMHLDLSGLWRKRQMRSIMDEIAEAAAKMPTVLMGDTNEWRTVAGCLNDLEPDFQVAPTGPSFHARHPVAQLDRIIVHRDLKIEAAGVHMSPSRAAPPIICRSGRGYALTLRVEGKRWLARDLAQAAALDRRADAHRLAIFDDGPPRDLEALALQ